MMPHQQRDQCTGRGRSAEDNPKAECDADPLDPQAEQDGTRAP